MINKLYIYTSNCLDPHKNLATEKYIMDNVDADSMVLYLWQNQNTIVIGRNQNPWLECRCELMKSENVSLARRLSGGGAVFHDIGNLNFTFILNTADYDIERQMSIISSACRMAGIETELSGRNDILAEGRKFSGNAFYNSQGKSYHHGTILINADTNKMSRYLSPPKAKFESKGVKSVKSRVINLCELSPELTVDKMKKHMISAAEEVLSLPSAELEILQCDEINTLAKLYGSWDYLYGKSVPFSIKCDGSFGWGNVQVALDVKNGIIKNAEIYTDSMDWTISEKAAACLMECPLDAQKIHSALLESLGNTEAEDLSGLIREKCI